MSTTPTTKTNHTTTGGYPPYLRTPADAITVDPRAYPDHDTYIRACIARQNEHLDPLWQMDVAQRIAAMRRGELTLTQLTRWASRYPEQVPTINGEFEFIAALTPEIAEAD